ncbi:MAG: C2 family cysteine protease [Deltaproteobacteria bacterium]|nr:C2 family cysteine protease [Deltaproteobacteria bacterium]
MRINDKQLRPIATRIEGTPQKKVDDNNVLEILAAVGDKSGRDSVKTMTELQKPGMTRQQQLDVAKAGLSKTEKKDIETLLDTPGFTFAPKAKNFLEALIGRASLEAGGGGGPLPPPPSGITADTAGIRGQLQAGVSIEAINLSSAPDLRLHLEDTKEIGKADAQGKFSLDANKITGTDAMTRLTAGDVIRIRGRRPDGTTTDWIDLKVQGRDTTNAQFNPLRVTMTDDKHGKVGLTHNSSRPITEPGASIRFINLRTGDIVNVKADKDGSIPKNLQIAGKAGDAIAVAVSDGVNNTDLKTLSTTMTVIGGATDVDIGDDPTMHKDELKPDGTAMYPLKRYNGPLFLDGVKSSDVRQGAIGDCFFPSAVAAVAHQNPKAIENAITETRNAAGEREFNVKFYSRSGRMEIVTVDADLYTRSWGGPIYGTTTGTNDAAKMELWFPILEKAYAKWKGSYDKIGNGGSASDVMEAITGKRTTQMGTSWNSSDELFKAIKAAGDLKQPMAAGTHDDEKKYANSGVYADHSYSLLGAEEIAGKKYVLLRNPWGESEAGNDGKNDGYFKLEMDKFMKLYDGVDILRA